MSEQTLHSKLTSAELCRRNGWTVGTHLTGDEGYGPTTIVITAIGKRNIVARSLDPIVGSREGGWVLWCREWSETDPRPKEMQG